MKCTKCGMGYLIKFKRSNAYKCSYCTTIYTEEEIESTTDNNKEVA